MALSEIDKSQINSTGRIIWLDIVKLFAIFFSCVRTLYSAV